LMQNNRKFWYEILEKVLKGAAFWCSIACAGIILAGLFILPVFIYFSKDLPDYHQLVEYDPPTISRLYTADGNLMSELAIEHRIYKTIDEIPALVKSAFIAAEDHNYYNHPGIDVFSIIRAALQNIANLGSDRNPVGGSTITQQVVKNFLLNNERSISRKIKEAILAYRINHVYSKDRILELYLNQIYLGNGAYGVAQAALSYFNKDMKDLTIDEAALLAAMPKAPSMLDPTRHPERAKARRDWVIDRMQEEKFITRDQAQKSVIRPIRLNPRFDQAIQDNGYYNESVRLELIDKYGFDHVYQDGFTVHTNLNADLQKMADKALRQGLIDYDRRHGWHGVVAHINFKDDEWKQLIKDYEKPGGAGVWQPAIVLGSAKDGVNIGLPDESKAVITSAKMQWARKPALKAGDIVLVDYDADSKSYSLEQIPSVNGALVVMQPKTGKVLALAGGYSFKDSKYNRAIQALRQPGSAFKPIVYLTALENGFAPNSIVRDEPISLSQGPGMPLWSPRNYEGKYLGPITMRKALEKSRNLATVHIVAALGVRQVAETATRLHVYKDPPLMYSMALGAYETTLLDLTAAYTTFASNGMEIKPQLIDRVFDRKGKLVYFTDQTKCDNCLSADEQAADPELPKVSFKANYLVEPDTNFQMVSMLEGVVQRGTAARAKQLGKHLAGKTGTSNESKDTWFIGFSPDLVVGVFVGFDSPKTLGAREQGASVALPLFIGFMKQALENFPDKPFPIPDGLQVIGIDPETGGRAGTFSRNTIYEVLKPGQTRSLETRENTPSELPPGEEATIITEPAEVHVETESLY